MKPKAPLRHFLAIAGSSLLAVSSASAANLWWDGGTIDIAGNGNSTSLGGSGTWDTTIKNWDAGAVPYVAWNNTTNANDTAVFAGTAGTVTLGTGISVGGLQLNVINYTLTGSTITLASNATIATTAAGVITIESQIAGASTALKKTGSTSTVRLTNANNSYSGLTSILGTIEVTSLGNGGQNSTLGSSSSAASNLLLGYNDASRAGTLKYIGGTNANTDRLFTIGIGGTTIDASGGGTLNFTNTGALAFDAADGPRTLTLNGTNTGLNIFNPLLQNNGTGVVSFTKLGAGTWVLANNSNSYTGQTNIQAGTLVIDSIANYDTNSAIGKGSSGTSIIMGNGANTGTLVYTGGEQSTNRTIQIGSNSNASGGATILNNGSGTLTFTTANSSDPFNTTYTNTNTQSRALTLGGTNNGIIQGVIQDTSATVKNGLTKIGSGTWTISGNNTYTGSTTLNAGKLKLDYSTNDTSKLSNTASIGTLLLNGGTLELSGGTHLETVLSTTLNNGTTFIKRTGVGASSTLSMGVINYSGGALDFSATGIANVSTSTVTNGILASTAGTARVTVGGSDWAAKDGSNNVVAYTGYTTFSGAATSANVNYSSVGNVTLSADSGWFTNTFKITTSASEQSMALGGYRLTPSSMLFAGAHDYSITNTSGGYINGPLLLHHYGSGTLTLGNTGGGAITQFGIGKTILTGNNASDVGINIFGGTVQFSNNLQIGTNATAKVIALNNGTLLADTTGGNIALNNAGTFSRTISLGAGGGTLDVIGGNKLTVSGVISDTAGQLPTLTIGSASSNGTIELTGANTYTGATNLAGGIVNLGVAQTGTTGPLGNHQASSVYGTIFMTGGTLQYSAANNFDYSGRLSTAGNQTWKIDTNSQTVTFATALQGTSSTLTKSGLGALTLTGANTYTGATTVSAGTLAVNGSLASTSAVTVASTATLGGSGAINSSVTIQNGGTLAAGTSIESLATGTLSLEAGATLAYEADNNIALSLAGDLTAITGNLTFDLTNAAILTLAELGSESWTANEKLTLISYSGTWNGGLLNYLGGTVNDDSGIVFSGYNWTFNYNDTVAGSNYTTDLTGANFVTMTAVSAIPEPGAALLGGLGLLILLRRRRA